MELADATRHVAKTGVIADHWGNLHHASGPLFLRGNDRGSFVKWFCMEWLIARRASASAAISLTIFLRDLHGVNRLVQSVFSRRVIDFFPI